MVRLSVVVTPELHCFLTRHARTFGFKSVSALVRKIIEEYHNGESSLSTLSESEDDY